MYLNTQPNCILKNGQEGKFYALCILSQFLKLSRKCANDLEFRLTVFVEQYFITSIVEHCPCTGIIQCQLALNWSFYSIKSFHMTFLESQLPSLLLLLHYRLQIVSVPVTLSWVAKRGCIYCDPFTFSELSSQEQWLFSVSYCSSLVAQSLRVFVLTQTLTLGCPSTGEGAGKMWAKNTGLGKEKVLPWQNSNSQWGQVGMSFQLLSRLKCNGMQMLGESRVCNDLLNVGGTILPPIQSRLLMLCQISASSWGTKR